MKNDVGEIGELALIEMLKRGLPRRADVRVGAGDDCAVVDCRRLQSTAIECNRRQSNAVDGNRVQSNAVELVLKSDPVIEGRHFRKDEAMGRVGRKAVGRVLSDFAAMGAAPRWGLVNLVLRPDIAVREVAALYRGMQELGGRYGFAIVGGDTSQGKEFAVHVFGVGTLPRGSARLRSMAKAEDAVYVTGTLGGSLASGKHLDFEPRVKEGIFLRRWANAMIDVSDGLASELWHIARASGVGIEVRSEELLHVCKGALPSPLRAALCDGEDFELLFTVPRRKVAAFERVWRRTFPELSCTCIGRVRTGKAQVVLDGKVLKVKGYEHFIKRDPPGAIAPPLRRRGI